MYMYYLLGWRLDMTYYRRWLNREDPEEINKEKEVSLTGTLPCTL